ncbi:MAG: hypothetical protein AABY43_07385 [Candidatus Omnitrophota bacterium]
MYKQLFFLWKRQLLSCNPHYRRPSKDGLSLTGFTFIELLFIVIIIAVLVAVSFPNLRKSFNSIELNSFSREISAVINYLEQRSIVDLTMIHLNIDNEKKEYYAVKAESSERFKTYRIPEGIRIETEGNDEIIFYPDGSIDKVTIRLINSDNQEVILTTKGVYGGVKVQNQE